MDHDEDPASMRRSFDSIGRHLEPSFLGCDHELASGSDSSGSPRTDHEPQRSSSDISYLDSVPEVQVSLMSLPDRSSHLTTARRQMSQSELSDDDLTHIGYDYEPVDIGIDEFLRSTPVRSCIPL